MKFLLVQSEVDMHGILSTRMLLHLRECAERDRRVAGRGRGGGTVADAFEYSTTHATEDWHRVGRHELSTIKFGANPLETIDTQFEPSEAPIRLRAIRGDDWHASG